MVETDADNSNSMVNLPEEALKHDIQESMLQIYTDETAKIASQKIYSDLSQKAKLTNVSRDPSYQDTPRQLSSSSLIMTASS